MTELNWHRALGDDEALAADGDSLTYIITFGRHAMSLTRYSQGLSSDDSVAAQASRNAIHVSGHYEEATALLATRDNLMRKAQQYEAGLDLDHHAAWRH